MVNQWYKLTNQLNKIKNDCKCLSFHTIMNVLKTQFNQTKIKLQNDYDKRTDLDSLS